MSFGVQAVQNDLLQKIGRIHTIKEAEMAIEMAQKIGFKNISMDLMYGLPWANFRNAQRSCVLGSE